MLSIIVAHFSCPECRKQHIVPDDGVFPPNFVVRNLLEEHGISAGTRTLTSANLALNNGVTATAKCTICEKFAPLRLCRHCNFMVCEKCLRAHRHGTNKDKYAYLNGKEKTRTIMISYIKF